MSSFGNPRYFDNDLALVQLVDDLDIEVIMPG